MKVIFILSDIRLLYYYQHIFSEMHLLEYFLFILFITLN